MAHWIDRRKAIRHRPGITTKAEERVMAVNATAAKEGNVDPALDLIPGFESISEISAEPEKKAGKEIKTNVLKESKTPMDKGKDDGEKEK